MIAASAASRRVEGGMRLALAGAFAFPVPQGSQVYFAEQARALAAAGAEVTLVVYGRGDDARAEALGPIAIERVPRLLSPRRTSAGPSARKPAADLALAAALVAAHRRRRFDAVLAHNAEAALAALLARPLLRRPVAYVAHTLVEHELPTYAAPPLRGALARAGRRLDGFLAARSDAVIALSAAGERALGAHARGPLARIPPGLAPASAPPAERVASACRRHGIEPGRFALYAGNLDGYQELGLLAAAAARLDAPVVVATHAAGRAPAPLRTVRIQDAGEGRELLFGAGVALLARRAPGGFPVKLLNYLEAGRAVVAHAGVADGLEHDHTAWLLPDGAGAAAWALAIGTLLADPARAGRLGDAGRAHLAAAHDPAALARALLERLAKL